MNLFWLTVAIAVAQGINAYLGVRLRMDGVPVGWKKLAYELAFLMTIGGTCICAIVVAYQIRRAPDAIANKVDQGVTQPQPMQAPQPSASFADHVADEVIRRLRGNRSDNLPTRAQVPNAPLQNGPQAQAQAQPPRPEPVPPNPVITSAPPIFNSGTIRGEHFGSTPGELHVRFQLKPAARTGQYENHWRTLLGNNDPANQPEMHPPNLVNWTDTALEIRPTADYKQQMLSDIESKARERNFPIPKEADLEIEYQVKVGDFLSPWFFPSSGK